MLGGGSAVWDAATPVGRGACRTAGVCLSLRFSLSRGKRSTASSGYGVPSNRLAATVERRPAQHVLVVDDDASIRLLCRINLELEGWTVREAATLAEARAELADGEVALTLLDVHVGTESGVAFLDELRRDHPRMRVAMLTGSVGTPTVDEADADAIVTKPFTLDQLSETVRTLIGERRIESSQS